MSLPDATASAALSASIIKPVFFGFLDIDGGQVYFNTSGANITPSATGDSDLDGNEFIGITQQFMSITPVRYAQGGSDSVTAELSGIPEIDSVTLALISNPANWRGRGARLWRVIRNAANVQQGGYHAYYTGRMTNIVHSSNESGQVLQVTIESYLAVFSQASNRTYMDQERFDAGDLSAQAAVAIANGNFSGAVVASGFNFDPSNLGRFWWGGI